MNNNTIKVDNRITLLKILYPDVYEYVERFMSNNTSWLEILHKMNIPTQSQSPMYTIRPASTSAF